MFPRKKLDIGWSDLHYAAWHCLLPARPIQVTTMPQTVVTLSVRTAFDLLLQHLALPKNSEILLSAVTIRDMVSIIEHHGLRAVAIELDTATCAPDLAYLRRAITPRTRLILVAHLFGSRMAMDDIIAIAAQHNLMVVEDCAQAFQADGYRGHPRTHLTLFSFGAIKTATALGGALAVCRDQALYHALNTLQHALPSQSQRAFLGKVIKYALLKTLSYPISYGIFVTLCRLAHTSHDRVINQAVRGFAGGELILKIRHQPAPAQRALLRRRLQRYTSHDLQMRIHPAQQLAALLPTTMRPAHRAAHHSYWVFPLQSPHPDQLVQQLLAQGFDATRGASSMYAVPNATPLAAHRMMQQMLYLPVDAGATPDYVQRLANAVLMSEGNDGTNHTNKSIESMGS